MTAWIALSRDKTFRTANPRFQVVRGALLLFASAMAFNALRHMPVAEFTAIVMLTPVLVTLLARVWLKERVSRAALDPGGRRLCRCADRHPAGQRPVRLGGAAAAGGGACRTRRSRS